MPEENDRQPEQISRDLTAVIVAAFLGGNQVAAAEIPTVISTVHQALTGLGEPTEPVIERTPAVPIRRSIQPDYIVCLECGHRGTVLKRHLASRHGLSVEEYRERWNLRPDYPIVAAAYSAQRSTMAKQLGLGRKREPVLEAPTPRQSKRPGRRRSKAP